jgi:cobyrinic acid a,c-diamide synthase
VVIAGLRGGSGKTLFTMGLLAAYRDRGRAVVPFKKGPDYIDAAWLGLASGSDCYNLDPYLMSREQVLSTYLRHTEGVDGAIIEGNRGLYDGVDEEGTYSTAELAKAIRAPVVVVVDATKTTRTAAAMVLGLRSLDPQVDIRGVVLNHVAGSRHERILRRSIEQFAGVRVLGSVPRLEGFPFPERHLGLVPPQEHGIQCDVLRMASRAVRENVDLEGIWEVAREAGYLPEVHLYRGRAAQRPERGLRVGVIRDAAFHFYYPDNLEALEEQGAQLVEINALESRVLPPLDGLYIGGGFPEIFAERLADNAALRTAIRDAAADGLPIYAECGGLMYLGKSLRTNGKDYPMVGALPLVTEFRQRPQGHGYTSLQTVGENPFFTVGLVVRGHEFHYSRIVSLEESSVRFAFRVERGAGVDGKREGILRGNTLATYTHLHALSCGAWGQGVVEGAARRRWERDHDGVVSHARC